MSFLAFAVNTFQFVLCLESTAEESLKLETGGEMCVEADNSQLIVELHQHHMYSIGAVALTRCTLMCVSLKVTQSTYQT